MSLALSLFIVLFLKLFLELCLFYFSLNTGVKEHETYYWLNNNYSSKIMVSYNRMSYIYLDTLEDFFLWWERIEKATLGGLVTTKRNMYHEKTASVL